MSAVPDRGHLLTEQRNPRTTELHRLGVRDLVRTIREEDRAVLDAMASAEDSIASLIEAAESGFTRGGRLIYLGAGTSGRLGVLDASEAPPTFQVEIGRVVGLIAGGDAALKKSSEHREDEPLGAVPDLDPVGITADDTVIGIAAGGTTPYVLGGLRWCSERPERPTTAMISCTPIDTPPGVDHLIVLPTGPEVVTGSTRMKAGTATKLALNTISTSLMIRSGRVYGNLMVDLRATNAKLRDRAARIVSELTDLPRGDAFELLDAAGGEVKTAAVMHAKRMDVDAARAVLAGVDGRLDRVLDA